MISVSNFLILDAARVGTDLGRAIMLETNNETLFTNSDENYLEAVAPFLFVINPNNELLTWFAVNGWNNSWGILCHGNVPFRKMHNHLQNLKTAELESGTELYFRFYDPRVLRIFLPTCDAAQLKEFFGPVEHFICEDEDPAFGIVFSLEQGTLKTQRVPVEKLFPQITETEDTTEPPAPPKQKSFTDQPLEYAHYEGNPEMMKSYLSGLSPSKLGESFSAVQNFYTPGNGDGSGGFVFSYSENTQSFIVEEVSDEVLSNRLEAAEKKREENQKAYSESIRKPKNEKQDARLQEDEPKKSKTWSWLKI